MPRFQTREAAPWLFLALPLLALGLSSLSASRADWPDLLPREATYLMQAHSLAEDLDLRYSRLDFDRILLGWRGNPPDLLLASASAGRVITFDQPALYSAWLAPFVKISPERGFVWANYLLLVVALAVAARVLWRSLGAWTPILLGLLAFGSLLFASVGRVDGDSFLASLTLLAFSALLSLRDGQPGPGMGTWRLLAAGALLATVALADPLALFLLPIAWAVLPPERRAGAAAHLALGFAIGGLALILVHFWQGGGLYLTATSRFKFTPETGYPLVDFPAGDWQRELQRLAAVHWDGAPRFSWGLDPRLAGWNAVYLLAGRHVGLLPYAAPLLLLLLVAGRRLPWMPLALAGWAVALLVWRPFNFFGGPGPLGTRSALIWLAAAIVLLPAARDELLDRKSRWAWLALALGLALAFVLPSWRLLGAWPFTTSSYTQLAPAARFLPFEASQRWLYRAPFQQHQGLWIAPLDDHLWVEAQRDRLMLDGAETRFLAISQAPLRSLAFQFGADLQGEPTIGGGELGERLLAGDGRMTIELLPSSPRRHALWLGPEPLAIHTFSIQLRQAPAEPLALSLTAEREGDLDVDAAADPDADP